MREHPLLVAARTQTPELAGEGQQVVVAAALAADASEAAMQITAVEEALDRAPLDGAPDPLTGLELGGMPGHAPPQRTRARSAAPVDAGRPAADAALRRACPSVNIPPKVSRSPTSRREQQTERFLLLLNGRNEIVVAIFMTELLANFTLEKPYDLELAPGQDLAERALAG